jgi:manganese oxidase
MPNNTKQDASLGALTQTATSRRAFLRTASLTAVSAGALAACGKASAESAPSTAVAGGHDAHGAGAAAPAAPADPRAAADAIDAMHEAGIKAFPAKTSGKGNQLLAPKIMDDVKVYELSAREMKWETAPGQFVNAMAYNEQVPGIAGCAWEALASNLGGGPVTGGAATGSQECKQP